MMSLQTFCGSGLPSAVFQPSPRPHSAAPCSSTFSASRRFTLQLGGRRIHGGAAVPIERILNLSDISVFGKRYSSFSREAASPDSLSRLPPSDAEPARLRLARHAE